MQKKNKKNLHLRQQSLRTKGNTRIKKIRTAIYENPHLLGELFKDCTINNGMIYSQLKKVLNYRIGIEFELAGNFVRGYYLKYHPEIPIDHTRIGSGAIKDEITKHYGFKEFNPDNTSFKEVVSAEPSITEIRVSLNDHKSLVGLYDFMNDLNSFCMIHPNGGIHFHLDLSEYFSDSGESKPRWSSQDPYVIDCLKWTKKRINRLGSIFPKYTGSYNKKDVAFKTKGNWINFSRLTTMEVRIAPLTFEYSTIIRWISDLTKFRNEMLNQCGLSKSRGSAKMSKAKKTTKKLENNYIVSEGSIELSSSNVISSRITDLTSDADCTPSQYDERLDRLSRNTELLQMQLDDLTHRAWTIYHADGSSVQLSPNSSSYGNYW